MLLILIMRPSDQPAFLCMLAVLHRSQSAVGLLVLMERLRTDFLFWRDSTGTQASIGARCERYQDGKMVLDRFHHHGVCLKRPCLCFEPIRVC
jgi:hypothetical protein